MTPPPWGESIDEANPAYRPRGHRESLCHALLLLEFDASGSETPRKEIHAVAQRYNALVAVASSAPRFKRIESRLLALRSAYAKLVEELSALDSATLEQIHDPRARGDQRLYRISRADWLREPHIVPFMEGSELEFESPLIRARAMAKYLDRVIELFRGKRETDRGAVDRGGKENFFRTMHGHEKEDLVRNCADLFDKYGLGDRITSAQTGPFFSFVSHVYDFAVGEASAGESSGLADPIKQVVRDRKKLMAEVNSLVNRRPS